MSSSLPVLVLKEWELIQSQSHITARLHRIRNLLHVLLKIYFHKFSSKKTTDHPITDERLLVYIQALLDLFAVHLQSDALLCGPQLKSKLSKDAEKFCIDALLNRMLKLNPEKLKRFTHQERYKYFQQQAHGKPFIESITLKLIERVGSKVRKKLKNLGVDCKVVRGKAH